MTLVRLAATSSYATAPAPQRPVLLGSYELLREVAIGQFCSLYLAQARGLDTRANVLIKRLRVVDASARARLLREGRVGLGLRAHGLVRVLEIHDEPELFLVMEYVEGMSLRALLARARGADVSRYLVPIFLDALRGLSALHNWRDEAGTPSFLVHQAPSARHLLVGTDGLTRLIDLANVHGSLLGPAPGSEHTLVASERAPEQVSERHAIDPRSDLYILGCALSGALLQAAQESPGIRVRVADWLEVCRRATAPRRSDRYWSAEEMEYALRKAAAPLERLASAEDVGAWVRRLRSGDAEELRTPPLSARAPEGTPRPGLPRAQVPPFVARAPEGMPRPAAPQPQPSSGEVTRSGVQRIDAGEPSVDTGEPSVDAGEPSVDAGEPSVQACAQARERTVAASSQVAPSAAVLTGIYELDAELAEELKPRGQLRLVATALMVVAFAASLAVALYAMQAPPAMPVARAAAKPVTVAAPVQRVQPSPAPLAPIVTEIRPLRRRARAVSTAVVTTPQPVKLTAEQPVPLHEPELLFYDSDQAQAPAQAREPGTDAALYGLPANPY